MQNHRDLAAKQSHLAHVSAIEGLDSTKRTPVSRLPSANRPTRQSSPSPRAARRTTFWGDVVGNLQRKPSNPAVSTYTYDPLGRRITETTYDTLGNPVQTTQVYFSPSGQVLEERLGATPSTATPKYQYVWGLGNVNDLVLRVDVTTGVRLYAQQDANGNVTALIDPTGAVQERYQYDPYGTVTVLNAAWSPLASSAFSWIYLFQGSRLDTSTGWYKFGARDYVPSQGTWAEPDPITFGAGDNFYQFVGGNPAGLADPSGLIDTPPGGWNWPIWDGFLGFGSSLERVMNSIRSAELLCEA